jgi:hypothetical protein
MEQRESNAPDKSVCSSAPSPRYFSSWDSSRVVWRGPNHLASCMFIIYSWRTIQIHRQMKQEKIWTSSPRVYFVVHWCTLEAPPLASCPGVVSVVSDSTSPSNLDLLLGWPSASASTTSSAPHQGEIYSSYFSSQYLSGAFTARRYDLGIHMFS